jgi:hypothetical protein
MSQEHEGRPPHPVPGTVENRPIFLCATVTTDHQVARARIYFRRAGEKY